MSASTYVLSCQYYSPNTQYFRVPLSVLFHHCSVLLCSPGIIPPVLSTSVLTCQYHSTFAQYFCFPLSAPFHHFSVLLCSSASIFPPVLSTPVFSVSTILPLPNTSVFPCQHHSTSSQYFCVNLSVPFHHYSGFLCSAVSTFPPTLRTCCSTIHAVGSTVLAASLSNNSVLCRAKE